MIVRILTIDFVFLIAVFGTVVASDSDARGLQFFEKKIRPVLVKRCYKCHSVRAKKVQAGFRLDSRAGIRKGGESGRAIVPGNLAKSPLIKAIRHDGLEMPPDGKLPKNVIADFEHWVKIGAPDPRDKADSSSRGTAIDVKAGRQFWSFRPLGQFEPPRVKHEDWVRTPVDRFVLVKLEEKGLAPNQIADRYKLVRRAYFDLIGLPPSPAEVTAFVADPSPNAYDRLVKRLLKNPHFGERWARHWLDIARFAESNGFEQDEDRKTAFHYRDFVIKAFNQDMPYDQFVHWQIAGDVLRPEEPLARTATGFLVAGVENIIQTEKEFERDRYDKLDDILSSIGTALLGLTVGCARCHDHKYDPLPQRDYYRFVSAFGKTISKEIPLDRKKDGLRAYAAVDVTKDNLTIDKKNARVGTKKENFVLRSAVYFLERGEVRLKQDAVTQSFPQVLMRAGKSESHWRGNGRNVAHPRVALARWITDEKHGAGHLLARVIVNRLWQHHMGTGLVSTPSDFGSRGRRPTHPQLLDWLASELIRSGWRLKTIHRLIMTSSAYMQTYREHAKAARVDPENRLLWRRSLRRLQAEAIRDTVLAISGNLDKSQYGPSTLDSGSSRRSIYLTVKRTKLIPVLQLFDAPDALQGIGTRQTTTVAPQALLLLNNKRIRQYSKDFAGRMPRDAPDAAIRDGFLIALSRLPSDTETKQMRAFLDGRLKSHAKSDKDGLTSALTDFCQLLMCLNEFVYVE